MDQAKRFWVLSFATAMIGCGGEGARPFADAGTLAADAARALDAETDAAIPATDAALHDLSCETTPSYEELRDTIFTPRCTTGRCHGGTTGTGPARGPNDFTARSTRDQLVGRGSVFRMGLVLVRPGDPEASFLMAKLTNDLPADPRLQGSAMPAGGDAPWVMLPESEIEAVRCWIAAGAP